MKIKQYRNLFENWQRHLVEGEVTVDFDKEPEKEAEKVVAASADELPGDVVAAPQQNVQATEDVLKDELSTVKNFEEQELPEFIEFVKSISPDVSSPEELKETLYRIITEELLKEEDRGGMEAQIELAYYLNEKILDENHLAIVNKKGSTTPDVVVVDVKEIYAGTAGIHKTRMNYNYKPVKYDQVPQDSIVSQFEVKSSTNLRRGKDGSSLFDVSFFDQTVGTGQLGKTAAATMEEFAEVFKDIANNNNIVFKEPGEDWVTADKYLSGKEPKEVFDALMNYGYFDQNDSAKCGVWGELTAPMVEEHDYTFWGEFGKRTKVKYYSALPFYKDAKGKLYFGDEHGDSPGVSQGKTTQLFFYAELLDVNKKPVKYYFKMTAANKHPQEFVVNGQSVMGYTISKTEPGTKRRAASTSGSMSTKCFRFNTQSGIPGSKKKQKKVDEKTVEAVKKHWGYGPKGGDNFFAIVAAEPGQPYTDIFLYKTREETTPDALKGLGEVPVFESKMVQNTSFSTYGLADVGQVRAKVAAAVKNQNEAARREIK